MRLRYRKDEVRAFFARVNKGLPVPVALTYENVRRKMLARGVRLVPHKKKG